MFDILSHDDGIAMTTNTDAVCNPARLVLELRFAIAGSARDGHVVTTCGRIRQC
jgi:hypothetical protein